eukprot:14137128-Ditylum_brightwellii.AAC.1
MKRKLTLMDQYFGKKCGRKTNFKRDRARKARNNMTTTTKTTTTTVNGKVTTVTETSTVSLREQEEDGVKKENEVENKVKNKVKSNNYCTISSTRKLNNKRINWSTSYNWPMLKKALEHKWHEHQ